MDLPYILKLNSFALKRRTDIIAKVKRIAPHMNLYDIVSYACWEIDAEELRRSTSDDASVASTVHPPPPATVSISPIVETFHEDDDDDESDGMPAPSLLSTTISDTPSALEQLATIAIVILTRFGSNLQLV